MVMRRGIDRPFSGFDTCTYDARQDPEGIHLVPERDLNSRERFGLVLILVLAVLPLVLYVTIATAMIRDGAHLGWMGHSLGLGFALLFLVTVGYQVITMARFRGSTLGRDSAGAVILQHHWSGGSARRYFLEEPVCLVILLDHEAGAIIAWRKVTDDRGITQREKFLDVVEVELELHAKRVTPRMPLQAKHWVKWLPRYAEFYHRTRDAEANVRATIDAMRPLADAVRTQLYIPVEFRMIGGTLVERLESRERAATQAAT